MRKIVNAVSNLLKEIAMFGKCVVLFPVMVKFSNEELEGDFLDGYEWLTDKDASGEEWEEFYKAWREELGARRMKRVMKRNGLTM